MKHSHRFPSRIASCALGALLVVGLAACAPEPGSDGGVPSEVAGQGGKNTENSDGESSWGQPTDDINVDQRHTEIPLSFPQAAFPIPANIEVYDIGERGEGVWYLLLLATAEGDAAQVWDEVIAGSGFTVADETTTPEGGRSASLANASLRVVAVTLPQPDGTIQLSYDISRIA